MSIEMFRFLFMCVAVIVALFIYTNNIYEFEGGGLLLYFIVAFCWLVDGVERPLDHGGFFYIVYQYMFSGTCCIRFLYGFGVLYPCYSSFIKYKKQE